MNMEYMKECICLNLHLANKFMEKGDFALAIFRLQDARQLLEELELLWKILED